MKPLDPKDRLAFLFFALLLVLGAMFVAMLDDASDLVKAEKMKSECSEKVQAAMSAYAQCQACAGKKANLTGMIG